MQQLPSVKDIVLIGGGHSHALVIRMWAMNPVPGLRLTLISPQVYTPYSGMLPGLVAGHYTFKQAHIDLQRVCAWAGIRFIKAEATAIDATKNSIHLKDRPTIEYDVCSVDIGSTPNNTIEGCEQFAIGVKPISRFYQHWLELQKTLLNNKTDKPFKIAIIGGGAGGIELITAMAHWVKQQPKLKNSAIEFTLLTRGEKFLSGYPKALQQNLIKHLKQNNIEYHLGFDTQKITQNYIHSENIKIPYQKVFYCTQANAASWLESSQLELNEQGFIKVNNQLQSTSHANVFAAGDIAHQVEHPRPKAGVYAVRMGPVLFNNLIHYALEKPLKSFKPQKDFLSLLALGDKFALGSRKPFSFSGAWAWRWKDHIDVKFMNLFHQLPDMKMEQPKVQVMEPVLKTQLNIKDIHELNMRCGGCGGKLGANVLSDVLSQVSPYPHPDVLIGLNSPDDAAVINIPKDQKLVQTLDHLKTMIDDPYLFGQLSALHALSDAFAMNAQAQSAQALVQLPLASEAIQKRDMLQLMQGALKVLNEHKCALVGGHSSEDTELNLGFCINALAQQDKLLHKQGAVKGQRLILTQPLGTGTLFAAHMRGLAQGVDIQHALAHMLQSNQKAGEIFHQYHASACTDVTGFGLMGHLVEMLKGTGLGAQLQLDAIPALPGSLNMMKMGIFSTLQKQNGRLRQAIYNQDSLIPQQMVSLLFDPQTSGGLLATVNAEHSSDIIKALHTAGYNDAVVIGEITDIPNQGLVTLN